MFAMCIRLLFEGTRDEMIAIHRPPGTFITHPDYYMKRDGHFMGAI